MLFRPISSTSACSEGRKIYKFFYFRISGRPRDGKATQEKNMLSRRITRDASRVSSVSSTTAGPSRP